MTKEAPQDRSIPIRSISRSIAVLRAISGGKALNLQEISDRADIPYPTAFRIVQTLVHEGLIECDPYRKVYRATALIQSLSHGFREHGKLVNIARPHIVKLTREIAWPVALTTRVGQNMIVRDSTHPLTSLTFSNYYAGHTMPILSSASGYAYLAFASAEERAIVIHGLKMLEGTSDMLSMFES